MDETIAVVVSDDVLSGAVMDETITIVVADDVLAAASIVLDSQPAVMVATTADDVSLDNLNTEFTRID